MLRFVMFLSLSIFVSFTMAQNVPSSLGTKFVIGLLDGSQTINNGFAMKTVETYYLFARLNKPGERTQPTLVKLDSVGIQNNPLLSYYERIGLEKNCLTQSQIVYFCQKNNHLAKNFIAIFLTRNELEWIPVSVCFIDGTPTVFSYKIDKSFVDFVEKKHGPTFFVVAAN